MTDATPEQIEAGVAAFGQNETLSVRRLLEVAYPVMRSMEAKPDPEGLRRAVQDSRNTLLKTATGRVGSDEMSIPRSWFDSVIRNLNAALSAKPSLEQGQELVEALRPFLPITVNETADYAELTFGDHETQAMTLRPDDWLKLNAAASVLSRKQSGEGS